MGWRLAILALPALLALAACATPGAVPAPHRADPSAAIAAEELLFAAVPGPLRVSGDALLFESLALPRPEAGGSEAFAAAPHRLRPCCAFGHGLGVRLGAMPLPGFRLDNVLEPRGLGPHRYDPAPLALGHGVRHAFLSPERNGLVYTRRGGFVDLAHVRVYADWTVYLAHQVEARLASGGTLRLPDEGGTRTLHLAALAPSKLDRLGRRRLAAAVAERVAWQLSLWHEAATWYGWSSLGIFPERVSAFSPEDLYSNALGIRLAGALLRGNAAESRSQYEANMEAALPQVLERLGAVSAECSRRAARLVDHIWWDSRRRLPRSGVVIERNFQTGPELVPWRVSLPVVHVEGPEEAARPVVLRAPARRVGVDLDALVLLKIEPELERARRALGHRVEGRDLESVVRRARAEALGAHDS